MRKRWLLAATVLVLASRITLADQAALDKEHASSSANSSASSVTSSATPIPSTPDLAPMKSAENTLADAKSSGGPVAMAAAPRPRPSSPDCPRNFCGTCDPPLTCHASGSSIDIDTGLTSCTLANGSQVSCTGGQTIHQLDRQCVSQCGPGTTCNGLSGTVGYACE